MTISQKQMGWLLAFSLDVGIFAGVWGEIYFNHVNKTNAIAVTWIVLVALNLLMFMLRARKLTKLDIQVPKSFYVGISIAALMTGLTTTAMAVKLALPSSDIALAQSDISLNNIQPIQRRLLIEMLRKDIAATKINTEMIQGTKPVQPDIYSVASFANADVMKNMIVQLQPGIAEDQQYSEQILQDEQDFRAKMAHVDPAYLQSWDASRKEEVDANAETMRQAAAWWTSFQDLYGYAADHAAQIVTVDGKLGIHDGDVRDTFNEKLNSSKQLYDSYTAAVQKGVDAKKQAQARPD